MIHSHDHDLNISLEGLSKFKSPLEERINGKGPELKSVLVIGHGQLAERQKFTHELWVSQGTKLALADSYEPSLSDAIDGSDKFVLDKHDANLQHYANQLDTNMFDVLLINNAPQHHLTTALKYGYLAKKIIIQKPQDLNFPLIETILDSNMYDDFRGKCFIHDHYRNKGVIPALYNSLPEKMYTHGKIKKMMFFITESKNVLAESARSEALRCGMIQDLGVHMFDIFLETLMYCDTWLLDRDQGTYARRIGGNIELMAVSKKVQLNTPLGEGVETFAAIDVRVTEKIQMPITADGKELKNTSISKNTFDVLFVLGKGVHQAQGVAKDVKSIVIEHERPGDPTIVDLSSLGSVGGVATADVNYSHGGMNRPLMLMATEPPEHAVRGLGGFEYAQWQSMGLGQQIAKIAQAATNYPCNSIDAYVYGRSITDLLRDMTTNGEIRSVWQNVNQLGGYTLQSNKSPNFID